MRRRDFLASALAGTGSLLLLRGAHAAAGSIHQPATRPLRILFLGGTDFVGPAIVELALERGHEVTLFNRWRTNPWLYTHLERLVGNRYPDRGDGLSPLEGDRTWDVVIDTWRDSPLAVQRTAELLRDRVEAYVYISSIAVYQGLNYRKQSYDESAPLPPAEMPTSFEAELSYPVDKQLGEEAVAAVFPERHVILRAYGIMGVDGAGRLPSPDKAYWPARLHRGGEVLAPGDGLDFTQWTDVRDLAEFAVHAIENGLRGAYNVSRGATFERFLGELAELSPNSPRLTWVPAEFLIDRGVLPFEDVPLWVWRGEVEKGCCFFHASTEKARAAGLRARTIHQTFRPALDTFLRDHGDHDFAAAEDGPAVARREEEVLAAWHEHRAR